jgi:hypothetical protein
VNGSWFAQQVVGDTLAGVIFVAVGGAIAKATKLDKRLLQAWRSYRADQKHIASQNGAILANQKTILGERFERPTT